jgi:hypothetical protein
VSQAPLILTAGDFNGDGFHDLAAGSPNRQVGTAQLAGGVHVLYGSAAGPTVTGAQLWTENSSNVPSDALQAEFFGAAVTAGDFNGDQVDDLAIGVRSEVSSAAGGGVVIIHGSASGLQAPSSGARLSQLWTQGSAAAFGPVEANDEFGRALAAGDMNGDGFDDLAIGVPGEDLTAGNDVGVVHVIYGSPSGLSLNVVRPPQNLTQQDLGDAIETGDRFGSVLTSWNFGRSAQRDLAIGVPLEDLGSSAVDAGLVHVVYGSASGLTQTGNQIWSQNSTGIEDSSESGDRFGQAAY